MSTYDVPATVLRALHELILATASESGIIVKAT